MMWLSSTPADAQHAHPSARPPAATAAHQAQPVGAQPRSTAHPLEKTKTNVTDRHWTDCGGCVQDGKECVPPEANTKRRCQQCREKNRTCNCSFWMESDAIRLYDRLLDLGFTLEQIDRRVCGASPPGGTLDKCKTYDFRGDDTDADDDLAPPRVGPTASRSSRPLVQGPAAATCNQVAGALTDKQKSGSLDKISNAFIMKLVRAANAVQTSGSENGTENYRK
ncbi:hypothetical protein PaG_06475 [Moesziomyces aphidis]|uniref:Uncharacterized protein n=1 Tax=Moesziomyces aphidis TaxID=84754 RepID=W3VDF1_MOEAP|nr:hypothetical protein PaG_06475 [Moesziomyces aphidis]